MNRGFSDNSCRSSGKKLRIDEDNWRHRRGTRTESESVQHVEGRTKRNDSVIDYDQLEIDAAHLLGVYDVDLIYSWTPRQFRNFVKGSQLKVIDSYELAAASAMFTAKARNSRKRIKLSDIYDANKIRKSMDKAVGQKEETFSLERYRKAKEAMKSYSPSMKK